MIEILNKFYNQSLNYFYGFKNYELKNMFIGWSKKEIVWLFACIFLTGFVSIATGAKSIIFIYSILGIVNLILVAKGKLINYLFGLISCFLYAIIAFKEGVYGQGLLFLFFFTPMQLYGWYIWSNPTNMANSSTVKAKRLTLKDFLQIIGLVVVSAIIYGYLVLHLIFNQTVGLIPDSVVGVVSIIAFLLMVRSYAEQWALWIIIDILTIIIWVDGLVYEHITMAIIPLIITRVLTLINAFYGYISWIKMHKKLR
jgi:nicotinamide mononucleotide transporter